MDLDEKPRIAICPWRQTDMVHLLTVLTLPKVQTIVVFQELGKIEQLRNEFFDVSGGIAGSQVPGGGQIVKGSVGNVKAAVLILQGTKRYTLTVQQRKG